MSTNLPNPTPKQIGHSILAAIQRAEAAGPRTPAWAVHAKPYAHALCCVHGPDDLYGCESAKSIALYLLSNLAGWRGSEARVAKAALKMVFKIE